MSPSLQSSGKADFFVSVEHIRFILWSSFSRNSAVSNIERRMGGTQSSSRHDAEDEPCGPCFTKAPFARPTTRSIDTIGSPMPSTPIDARRKKFAVEDAMLGQTVNNPIFSSRYGGLEKEVEPTKKENGNGAQIYQGKVSHPSYEYCKRKLCIASLLTWATL